MPRSVRPESAWLIPDDWDGESWCCVQIQWPDSPQWLLLLRSLLYSLTRGRSWDSTTGSITDTQQIGWEIFNRNLLLAACAGNGSDTPPGAPGDLAGCGGSVAFLWEELGVFITDITINTQGQLVLHYGPCCEKVVVGTLLPVDQDQDGETITPDDQIDPDYKPTEGSGCGAATYIIAKIFAVGQSISDHLGNPLTFISNVKSEHPDVSLGTGWLWNAYLTLLQIRVLDAADPVTPDDIDILWDEDTILDPERQQRIVCMYARQFPDEYVKPPEKTISRLQDTWLSVYPLFVANWWQQITLAIGYGDLCDIGYMGSADTTATCACPGEGLPGLDPTVNGWYLSYPLDTLTEHNDGTEGWKPFCRDTLLTHDIFGCVWDVELVREGAQELQWSQQDGSDANCAGTSLWGDSSQPAYNLNLASGNSTVLNELLGTGNYVAANGGRSWNSDPATPNYLQGATVQEAYNVGWNRAGTIRIKNFRWIHNINSPSHGT